MTARRALLAAAALLWLAGPAEAQISADFGGVNGGALRIGSTQSGCITATKGAIRFNSTGNSMDYCSGTAWTSLGGGSVTAAGSDKQLQYNNNGALAGASGITYNSSNGAVGIGTASPAAPLTVAPPAVQTVAAGFTITADACGTIKQIQSGGGGVSSDTTNPITNSTAAGCCMDIINVGSATVSITTSGSNIHATNGTTLGLTQYDTVRMCSNGSAWYQIGSVATNQ